MPDENKVETGLTIKVGDEEKTFKPEDVSALLQEREALAQKLEGYKPMVEKFEAWEKEGFKVSPEDYMTHSSAALALIEELQEAGLVDEQGNVIGKKEDTSQQQQQQQTQPPLGTQTGFSEDKIAAIVAKALEPFAGKLQVLEQDTGMILRKELESKILTANPLLDSDDIQKLFGKAAAMKGNVYEMAKALSTEKETKLKTFRESIAKELGVDPKQLDENKLREQKAAGGASSFAEGMKFSFKRGATGAVDPKIAMRDFFASRGLS